MADEEATTKPHSDEVEVNPDTDEDVVNLEGEEATHINASDNENMEGDTM